MKRYWYVLLVIMMIIFSFIDIPDRLGYIFLLIFVFTRIESISVVKKLEKRIEEVEELASASRRDTYSNYNMICKLSKPKKRPIKENKKK